MKCSLYFFLKWDEKVVNKNNGLYDNNNNTNGNNNNNNKS